MEKVIIHKNKSEVFTCQLKVDGASVKNTTVRLCLEFADNKNLFFYGKVKDNGDCTITIPKLKDLENTEGTLVIEAIADSTYFKLYEGEVEIKNSVEIEAEFVKKNENKEASISIEKPIKQQKIQEPIIVEETSPAPPSSKDGWKKSEPTDTSKYFFSNRSKPTQEVEKPAKKGFRKFQEYMKEAK